MPAGSAAIWPSFADAVLSGGVDIIQLRDKGSAGEQQFGPLEAAAELEALEILATAAAVTARCSRSTTGPTSPGQPVRTCYTWVKAICPYPLPADGRPRDPDRPVHP